MLYPFLQSQGLLWLFAPLFAESVLLVAALSFFALARLLHAPALAGAWPAGAPMPTREPALKRLFTLIHDTAPLIGLFGTVIGMIAALEADGGSASGAANLRGALASALGTTAYGLVLVLGALLPLSFHTWSYADE